MFKVLGGDGKEYGPVSADDLRQWVQQGRANGQTPVKSDGSPNWTPLSSLPEFSALFAPPPPGMTSAVGGAPIGNAPTSGLAITSLVMGILGFATCGISVILTAPLGLVLGCVAMSQIKKSEGKLKGQGLALAGTIVSGASGVMLLLLAAMLLPALGKAKNSKAQAISCMSNARQITLAVVMYAGDNTNSFPTGTNWCDALSTYAGRPQVMKCPNDTNQLRSGFAFNSSLSGMTNVPPDAVVIFESDAGWNASGGKELLIAKPRHGNTYTVGFADGHVEMATPAQLQQLHWYPDFKTNNNSNP